MNLRLLLAATLWVGCLSSGAAGAAEEPLPVSDAARVLQGMVRAYQGLKSLDQKTTYSSSDLASNALVSSRLVMERPNHLIIEANAPADELGKTTLTRYLCDGKAVYVYRERLQQYTKDKAPRNMAGFRDLASSVEMVALTGGDPSVELMRGSRGQRLEAPEIVDGVIADVVSLDVSDPLRIGEMRLWIGHEDHLLRRLTTTFTTRPPKSDGKAKPAEPPPGAPAAPVKTTFGMDNHVQANPKLAKSTFAWTAPPGALLYDPQRPTVIGPGNVQGAAGTKPAKIRSLQDVIKRAHKPR